MGRQEFDELFGGQEPIDVGELNTRKLTERSFPCQQCGAVLHYAIGTGSLECRYCGHANEIVDSAGRIDELDLDSALRQLQTAGPKASHTEIITCSGCAADFALDAHVHSGECPFCGTNVVTETAHRRAIKPGALLPMAITAEQARDSYRKWLDSLWFAPGELKKYARDDASLNGVYIPYWTYDSDTTTAYQGQRGDVYFVTRRYSTVVNGRRVTRTRQVPKVRWRPASGRTGRHFDDVLVGATRTLPRKITDWLEPWNLHELVPYNADYLSGFSSEIYQVDLDEGFRLAQDTMERIIRDDVRRAIGGDQQRITALNTQHSDTTFKHVLLPVWTAGFRFRDETYRFVVNGRTGKVRGERPYSRVKIALAVIAGLALAAVAIAVVSSQQGFDTGYGVPSERFEWPESRALDWGGEWGGQWR